MRSAFSEANRIFGAPRAVREIHELPHPKARMLSLIRRRNAASEN